MLVAFESGHTASWQLFEDDGRVCHMNANERRRNDDEMSAAKPSGKVRISCHQADAYEPQKRCPRRGSEANDAPTPGAVGKERISVA